MKYSETIDAAVKKTENNLNDERANFDARQERIVRTTNELEVAKGGLGKLKRLRMAGGVAVAAGVMFAGAHTLNKEEPNPYGDSNIPAKVAEQANQNEEDAAITTAVESGQNPELVIKAPEQ